MYQKQRTVRRLAFWLALILLLSIYPSALAQGPDEEPGAAPLEESAPGTGITANAQAPDTLIYLGGNTDDLPHPLGEEQRAQRQTALQAKVLGKTSGKTHEVAKGQFVELEREGEDSILTVLGEFGNLESPFGVLQGGLPGPLHNQIPEPDRSVNNTTIWAPDFSRDYYLDLLFSEAPGDISMRNFYIEMSSNRYTVNGDVTNWAQVPYRAAHYGRDYCGSIVCAQTWVFVRDSVNAWAATMSTDQLNAYLAPYDVWDRYDYDGDNNFDEPDGYIDHFQSVHAGEGQETGGGTYGADSIWSHRWYIQLTQIGAGGPIVNGQSVPLGGMQIGGSNYWIGDYTIEPENGGVGVFAHEFAHDLGLPDLYDTSGNTGGAENSTGFWTLMSSGSYGNSGVPAEGIGTKPMHMGAWEKFQLGWLTYDVAFAGQKSEHKLGPAETNTKQAQGMFVVLPEREVTFDLGAPYAGEKYFYSGNGNDLDNVMYTSYNLPAGAQLSAQVNYEIELDWDYAYLLVSTDGGASWNEVETNQSTNTDPHGQNFGFGITGNSGGWVELTADLSAYSGDVLIGFRYWTDGAAVEPGFSVDNIAINGGLIGTAESDEGWTLDGFTITTGQETLSFFNAYVAEYRQYRGYDDSLRTGPYNFGFANTAPNWVEHFPYQDGLLISYWNSQYTDNNVGDHPGEGLILPVDAHPEFSYWGDGTLLRPRLQSYDSTFTLAPTDQITVHNNTTDEVVIGPKAAVSVFDDLNSYWTGGSAPGRYQPGWFSVQVPNTGTQIRIKSISAQNTFMQVEVRPSK